MPLCSLRKEKKLRFVKQEKQREKKRETFAPLGDLF